jgi:hypothetical protein
MLCVMKQIRQDAATKIRNPKILLNEVFAAIGISEFFDGIAFSLLQLVRRASPAEPALGFIFVIARSPRHTSQSMMSRNEYHSAG